MSSFREYLSESSKKSGFVEDIEQKTLDNSWFRQVLYTAKNCQLVVMSLKPGEDIGEETHPVDQFFRVESGTGDVIIDGVKKSVAAGFGIVIPAGTKHNVINSGKKLLKVYTIYSPPHHKDGTVHKTKQAANTATEKFDGKTTE